MTNQQPKIFVGKCRGGYAIFAGASKLSTAFKTPELCQAEYDKNDTMYQYWAGSASVSIENTTPVIIIACLRSSEVRYAETTQS